LKVVGKIGKLSLKAV